MISVKRLAQWVILTIKHPRIWPQPTQFQNLSEIFKIEFPGNWKKSLISPESTWFTDSFPTFRNKKIDHRKKLYRFLIPEFNLEIGVSTRKLGRIKVDMNVAYRGLDMLCPAAKSYFHCRSCSTLPNRIVTDIISVIFHKKSLWNYDVSDFF